MPICHLLRPVLGVCSYRLRTCKGSRMPRLLPCAGCLPLQEALMGVLPPIHTSSCTL